MQATQFININVQPEGTSGRSWLEAGAYQFSVAPGGNHQAGDSRVLLDLATELFQQIPDVNTWKNSPCREARRPRPIILQAPENQARRIVRYVFKTKISNDAY